MYHKRKIYRTLRGLSSKEIKGNPMFVFYSIAMSADNLGFNNFVDNCKVLVEHIVSNGSAVTSSASQLRKRSSMRLPSIEFDKGNIKEIAKITRLCY